MYAIDSRYEHYFNCVSDINEHFPAIKKYASECDRICELGVRGIVSTWALLSGNPKKMISVDICPPSDFGANIRDVYDACKEDDIDFTFVLGDTLKIDIEETDLLFIDTLHTDEQLIAELKRHGNKAQKYIILHDTEACKDYFQNSVGVTEGGLQFAIYEFLANNNHWKTKEVFTNNNGLTVLERIR